MRTSIWDWTKPNDSAITISTVYCANHNISTQFNSCSYMFASSYVTENDYLLSTIISVCLQHSVNNLQDVAGMPPTSLRVAWLIVCGQLKTHSVEITVLARSHCILMTPSSRSQWLTKLWWLYGTIHVYKSIDCMVCSLQSIKTHLSRVIAFTILPLSDVRLDINKATADICSSPSEWMRSFCIGLLGMRTFYRYHNIQYCVLSRVWIS